MDELSLMSPGKQPNQFYKRRLKVTDHRPIPHRYYYVLSLHLSGMSAEGIAEETGYSIPSVYKILSSDAVVGIRQQILAGVQLEFEALYKEVVKAHKLLIASNDPAIMMQAVNSYYKEFGRLQGKEGDRNLTAEDVVSNILNNYGEINIQINQAGGDNDT